MYIYTDDAHQDVCTAITQALSDGERLNGNQIMATVQDQLECPRAAVMMALLDLASIRRINYERGPSGCFRWHLLPTAEELQQPPA